MALKGQTSPFRSEVGKVGNRRLAAGSARSDVRPELPYCRHSIFQVRPREAVLKALPKRRNVHELLGADAGPHRLDALDKVGVIESATRLEKLQHFEQQLVHRRIGGGELKQPL